MTRILSRPVARSSFRAALVFAMSVLSEPRALALQPVTEFLAHAKTWNPQNRAAQATAAQRDAEVGVSTGSLLPNFSASGTYTRNEYEVTTAALIPASSMGMGSAFPNIVIQPQNQLDANLMLTVPIINVANWDRRAAAKATLEGARADEAKHRAYRGKGRDPRLLHVARRRGGSALGDEQRRNRAAQREARPRPQGERNRFRARRAAALWPTRPKPSKA
jgi:hypothetical protein